MLKVKIKNFQSVADTSFEVDGFTVIVGKNNKGKSAIVRSIDAALSNRLGNNFIKWGKIETQVKLEKGDLDITWTKGETASYLDNNTKKPYTSLKGAVPQPILDAGFKKMEIADEKLNPLVAHQFEELFLINRSGPFVTETLSTLYDLNVINDADSLCQKKLKASKSLLKTRTADAETLSEKIEKFVGLDEVKKQIEGIKELQKKADALKAEIAVIDLFLIQVKSQVSLVSKLKELKKIAVPDLKPVTKTFNAYQWITQADNQYTTLNKLVENLKRVNNLKIPRLEECSQSIANYQWILTTLQSYTTLFQKVTNLKNVSSLKLPDPKKAEGLIQEVQTLSTLTENLKTILMSCEKQKRILADLKGLNTIVDRLKGIDTQVQSFTFLVQLTDEFFPLVQSVKDMKVQLQKAKTDYETSQKELEKFTICPLCKNPLTPAHTHE